MVAKGVELKGYGTMLITPINIKEQDWETVDPSGNPVESKTVGTRAKTMYVNNKGVEIPNNQVCKKFLVEDEEVICPKFSGMKEVPQENIEVIDDKSLIFSAIERKFYAVVTDNKTLINEVIHNNKSLSFPMALAGGWKIWNAILTNWNGKMLLVCCRGDLVKELEKYSDDTVEIEIEVKVPDKKLLKALIQN